MEKKFEKGSEEWQFFQDFYRFRQKWYEADNDDTWFTEMMEVGEKLIEKYANTSILEFVRSMVLDHFADVERRWKLEHGKTIHSG